MLDLDSIIQEINQHLDGEALVRMFHYHPDKIQLNGPNLKCFCPVHNELAFRSLIVNLKAKTYKCTMKWCLGFTGGSLVELWALYRKLEPIEAAMELVEQLKLPINLETVRQLGVNYVEKARADLEAGSLESARASIDQALGLDPRNHDLKLFSARLWEVAGDSEKALAERLFVLDARLAAEELAGARPLLDELLAAQPAARPLMERNIVLARTEGRPGPLKAALLQCADAMIAAGETEGALPLLEEAMQQDLRDAILLERLAALYLETGRRDDALGVLELLSDMFETAGNHDGLLKTLEQRFALVPEDLAIAEKIAEVWEGVGQQAQARAQWFKVVEAYAAQGRCAQAEPILERLLLRDPRDVELLQRQAELYVRAGDSRRAVAAFRHLAALAQEVSENTEVGEFFERARRIDPQDLGLRRDQAEWRLKSGDLDGGLGDLFALADMYLERCEIDPGMAVLSRIASLAPTDLDKRLRIGRCLERNGLADEAFAAYCQLAGDFMRQQQCDAALAICEEVRRLRPIDPTTLELRIDVHLALKQKSEAIEACREVAREALAACQPEQAEAALLRGVRIDRTEPAARLDLARLYEGDGRTRQAAELWIESALFGRSREDHAQACAAAREALRLEPENAEARRILAEGLEAQGQAPEALEVWEALAEERFQADFADPEAYDLYRHALALAPRRRSLLARLAALAPEREGAEPAREYYTRWLETFDLEPDLAEAIAAYRQAVERYPDELGWRMHLVTLLLNTGEDAEAAGRLDSLIAAHRECGADDSVMLPLLEQLVGLSPERLDLRGELAEGMARQGRTREAAHMMEDLGAHSIRQGDSAAAIPLLERALELRPELDDVLATLARLYEEGGQTGRALDYYERLAEIRRRQTAGPLRIQVIEKLLAFRPERLELRVELADLYEMEGDVDRAVEQRFALAREAAARPDGAAEAIEHCLKIRALAPEALPARELLVESLLQCGRSEEAKAELDQLGDMALACGRLDAAEECFKRIQSLDPEDIGASERLGKLYEAHERYADAAEAFTRVLDVYEKLGETARAIGVLKKLRWLQPDDLALSFRLARMLLAQGGDRREAAGEWMALLVAALQRGDDAQADQALEEATAQFATDWSWRLDAARALADSGRREPALACWQALAAAALEAREFETARDAAAQGLALDPDHLALRELRTDANCALSNDESAVQDLRDLAERAAAAREFERAEAYLRRALELQPRREEVLDELAEILAAQDRIDEACAIQRRLIEMMRHSDRLPLALKRARRIVELKPADDEARDLLASLLVESGARDEAVAVWRAMADRFAEEGETETAIGRYARLLDVLPGDIELMRRLADLTYDASGMLEAMAAYDRLVDAIAASGDAAALEAEYLRILDLEPGHLQLKERLADFYYEQNRRGEGRQALIAIVAAYRDERSQLDDALRVMRHLKALEPDDLNVREEEAVLLERTGRAAEAAQAWRQIAAAHRRAGLAAPCAESIARAADIELDSVELQLEAARLYGLLGGRERAIDYFLRAIEIHDRHDRLADCVPVLQEAIQLVPERLDLADALALLFERLGRTGDALQQWLALGEAHETAGNRPAARQVYAHVRVLLPEDRESRRRLARLCEAEGDRAGALRELRELAALAGRDGDHAAVAEHLKAILAIEPNDEPALRSLGEAWRSLGRDEELFQTLCLLERLYSSTGRTAEALAMLSELKSLRPDEPELMGRTIDLLIKTGQTAEAARQGIELIQSYFDHGDDHHALETLRRIAEIDPADVERRIALARLVHANGRAGAALQEFFLTASKFFGESRWEGCHAVCEAGLQLFADDMRLRDLLGRVLVRLGRKAEAIEVQLNMAALYDERGEDAKARRVYEMILSDQPDHQGALEAMIDWALRHGKTNVAVEHLLHLAESHYLAGRLDRAINAMAQIRELDPTRLEISARLAETYLESGDRDNAVRVWMETAAAMARAGRNEHAIEVYERLLTLLPDSVEVMAALAPIYRASGRADAYERLASRLGELHLAAGRAGDALALYQEIAQRAPHDLAAWERLAGLYKSLDRIDEAVDAHRRIYEIHRAQRRLDQARKALEAALALRPGDGEMLESLGDLCLALSRRPEGISWLAQAAQAHHAAARHERARDLAQRILKLDPLNLDVRRLLGEALEQLGDRPAAMEEYMQAARGYAEAYQNEQGIAILCHLLSLDPSRAEERELYAKLLQREGRVAESVSQHLILLGMVEQHDDPRRAIKYCRLILAEQPDNPQAHASLCDIYERTDKLRPALKECEWLADYYIANCAYLDAEQFIRKGLAWFPEDLAMRTRLIDMLVGLDRKSEAGEQLARLADMAEARADMRMTEWAMAKACEIEPDNLDHHCRLAEYQDRTGSQSAARLTRLGVIRMLIARERREEAREMAARVVASAAEDEALRLEIAELFELNGMNEAAAAQYHQLARMTLAREQCELARQYARHAVDLEPRLTAARETLIEALRAMRELNEAVEECDRLQEIHEASGEWDGALRALQTMIDMVPSRPEPRRRLVSLYRKMRREDAMIEQLRRLAEIYVNSGEVIGAIESLRELLDARPDDTAARTRYIDLYTQLGDESQLWEDYLHLARGCVQKGKLVEATRAYEKVIVINPEDPDCRDEFVAFLFEQGQIHRGVEETRGLAELLQRKRMDKEACRVLDRALNYAPQELDLRQRLADVYLASNRRGLALETYRSLARQYEHVGDSTRLLEVIEKIVEIDSLNVEFRQRLADLLMREARREEAFAQFAVLARQYEERGLADLAEHEYRRMLEIHPDDVQALKRLAEISKSSDSAGENIPELKRLADHYAAQGEIKETLDIYKTILQHEPDSTMMLNNYIDNYMQIGLEQDLVEDYLKLAELKIKKGEFDEAIRLYQRILAVEPNNQDVSRRLTETQKLAHARQLTPAGNETPANVTPFPSGGGKADTPMEVTLDKVIRNYENILMLNPNNPSVRIKLAEVLERAGQRERAETEWVMAGDNYLAKGEVTRGIEIYEQCLTRRPNDTGLRERLSRATLQRDSLRAIDGALR